MTERLKLAMQKSGRLTSECLQLLIACGLKYDEPKRKLMVRVENFPLDIIFLRDNDIPEYINNGAGDIGILGNNTYGEWLAINELNDTMIAKELGLSKCRLSIAVPNDFPYESVQSLNDKIIATSYPNILNKYLANNHIKAKIVTLSGSVEIAPGLGMADLICDIVSSGSTLSAHGLREVEKIIDSEAVIVQNIKNLASDKKMILDRLLTRMESVRKSRNCKYIMMHAPKSSLQKIKKILPGMEEPTIMELVTDAMKVVVHAVAQEEIFWTTIEELKQAGATSILVLPIEKAID